MKLIHYTDKPFSLEPRSYEQSELHSQSKPSGFWVSVEGVYDWPWWCVEETFGVERLVVSYDVILKEDANILYLETEYDILDFTKEYPYLREQWKDLKGLGIMQSYELDWNKVKAKYQGIIISPYQWNCRLDQRCQWYYGWDCASGCLWDLSCIKEIKLREKENHDRN